MKRPLTILLLVVLLFATAFLLQGLRHRRSNASEQHLSPLARTVLSWEPDTWRHLAGRWFIVHGRSADEVSEVGREAGMSFEQVGEWLNLDVPQSVSHLFIVDREELWEKLRRVSGLRDEGLSMQFGNEVFFLRAARGDAEKVQVPHEMVHLRLSQHFSERPPLWLEEGLASYLGWEMAGALHSTTAAQLVRTSTPASPAAIRPTDALTETTAYPDEPEVLVLFYRQTEELVRAISQTVGRRYLGQFVEAVVTGNRKWKDVLREDFNCTNADLDSIENRVYERMTTGAH